MHRSGRRGHVDPLLADFMLGFGIQTSSLGRLSSRRVAALVVGLVDALGFITLINP